MEKLKLIAVTDIKTENRTKDSKKNREFFTIEVKDASDVFGTSYKKNIFQKYANLEGTETTWKGISHAEVKSMVGCEIPGRIVTAKVQPYAVEGTSSSATKYTAVVLKSEDVKEVFANAGHVLDNSEVSEEANATAGNKALIA